MQMIERQLMTADELKALPKGTFVVMKTGFYPMKVKLKLFFDWGITFGEPYRVEDNGNRKVSYAEKREIIDGIFIRYRIGANVKKNLSQVAKKKVSHLC